MSAADHASTAARLKPWLTPRRAVMIVAVTAAAVHIILIGSVPLIITPDGQEYIGYTRELMSGGSEWHQPNRVPGYPFLMAIFFAILGPSGIAMLVMNHLLAVGTCTGIALAATRLGGALWGLIFGLLFVLDPWVMVFSSYATTELPTTAAVTGAALVSLLCRRDSIRTAVALGTLLTVACLMRPAVQTVVPFFGAAWVLRVAAPRGRRLILGAAVLGAFIATSLPWLIFNATHGVLGYARGSNSALWYGVGFFDLLDKSYPIDESTRKVYDQYLGDKPPSDDGLCRVIYDTNALQYASKDKELGDWAKASIRQRPMSYLVAVYYSLRWQLDCGKPNKPPMWDEIRLFAQRPFGGKGIRDAAPNFQGAGRFQGYGRFLMGWGGGILGPYMWWWGEGHVKGLPHVPLFFCAIAAVLVALWKREWGLAAFFLGTLAFIGAHSLLLMSTTRYSMPATTLWYIAAAWLAGLAWNRGKAWVTAPPTAAGSPAASPPQAPQQPSC